ncbi:lipocalin family protein [Tenacibaculum aestuariivivum]|uniref:lipocalin family protein n=1 Tax=Tenacibaculum aestuariivivum TaxID=2006131 RepID=UPI003AB3C317
MKKKVLFMLFIATLVGCKSTSIVNTKLDNKTEQMLKGDWTISTVNYKGASYFKVNSFNIEDSKCFIGSNWSFVSNNNKGHMNLNNTSTNCKQFNSPITWYINKEGNFVLKIINSHKAKQVNNGFVLNVNNLTSSSFDLVDKINVAGEIKNITYSFQRN